MATICYYLRYLRKLHVHRRLIPYRSLGTILKFPYLRNFLRKVMQLVGHGPILQTWAAGLPGRRGIGLSMVIMNTGSDVNVNKNDSHSLPSARLCM